MNKKIVSAMATMAIGALLIGGATFAYFNDTRAINNSFASGTLQFDVESLNQRNYPINFDIANIKPGDVIIRNFDLVNKGSLAVKQVWMDLDASEFQDANQDSVNMLNYLDQFQVILMKTDSEVLDDGETPGNDANTTLNVTDSVLTLKDLYLAKHNAAATLSGKIKDAYLDSTKKKINLAPTGLVADPSDRDPVRIHIQFRETNVSQNQYQGDAVKVKFNLEATQFQGTTLQWTTQNGSVAGNAYIPNNNVEDFVDYKPIMDPNGKVIEFPVTDN